MTERKEIFNKAADMLKQLGFQITGADDKRPWGGFFVIDEKQAAQFATHFFPEENIDELKITQRLSPKILLVAPQHRLSWQYHQRRAEIWKCIGSHVAVITSDTDEENEKHILHKGETIKLSRGLRHRLVGLDDWGVVAEIWQHTDASNPSDENDIVRLQDDYNRK
jgi:mannose-6-phosphate isomerase-like protein (cupin superfamily)